MSLVEQLSAITFLLDFLFGVMVGIVGCASSASRREDRGYSLLHAPPDPLCDGVRVIHGVYTRGDGRASAARHGTPPRHSGNDSSGAHGQEPER